MTNSLIPCSYEQTLLKPRILHIGFGAFARAHPMVYLHHGLVAEGGDWGVVAARLNSGVDALDSLDAVQGRYHIAEADGDTITLREIGLLCGTCHPARDGVDAIPALIASPDMSVILLTITEKGYCTKDGQLDLTQAAIQAELDGGLPTTAIGVLVSGLERRRAADLGGITILSCDNQPDNGALTRAAVLGFAEELDLNLAEWIRTHVRFPSSMVDRIVPAMTDDSHTAVASALGRDDPNAVLCEPFRQWVIEDDFANERPPFAEGGAMLVADVQPFEEMKLRLLNGAHTTLAWLGQLLGYQTVADCMADKELRALIRHLMLAEQAATLRPLEGIDLAAYADELLKRFENTRLRHRLDQIASDSSQKMPQRLFAPIAINLEAKREWSVSALAVAAWIKGLGSLPPVPDPRQDELRRAALCNDPVAAVLSLPSLVPDALRPLAEFQAAISVAFERLQGGAKATVTTTAKELRR
ncbi:Fructuronate reductase (plasmid) [Ruegeria sp. TM1040]|uniref:mannitol dehydrogenase family protein n=1 Tax=Ruegeria sp. (strain TM1040) TaxID=292414 RepID=UPI00005544D3|nr:mannitol dehydrogenase family protein [Ruegeria sp. TM1040]ABF61996.1 Fructuronate reductase [Ruegeria sp. TM1040]